MNFYDILKDLFKQFESVEEVIEKMSQENKYKHYREDSPQYYQEVLHILNQEIEDLNRQLKEKIKLKEEFEKKAYEKERKKQYDNQKEKNRKKYSYEDYEYDHSYKSSGNSYSGRKSNYDDKIAKHYAALEVPYGSDLPTVKKAYRNLLKKYHPDYFHHDPEKQKTATQLTQRLSEAYQALEKHLKK